VHFLAPIAFAFAATLPVVVVFYLLKRKRVVKLVSSNVLWRKFLAETQASAPFQRLRHNWLLILQLLLLALVILALARPYFAGKTSGGRLLVAILDASASMQSTDDDPSRFELARRDVLRLVDSMHDTDQMVLLLAAGHTEVKQSPTSSKPALRRAVQSCTVTDAPTRLGEALKLAQPLVRDRADAEVHLFSDGAIGLLEEFKHEGLNMVYHRFGKRAENLGIVTLDVRSHPDDPSRRAVFVSIANASTNPAQTDVELRFDGQLVETRPLKLGARETSPLVFAAAQRADAGIFTVQLTAKDDLAADNQASVVSLLPQPVRVLLVTRGNRFLEKALGAVSSVGLSVAADLADDGAGYDFVVVDNMLPTVWPAGNVLAVRVAGTNWFGGGGATNALSGFGVVEAPPIVDWKNTHPLLRFVNFDDVGIGEALAIKTPPWAVALVESPSTPLILAGEAGRRRVIWLGFDTLQSNWPRKTSFPIFMANAVEWLNPATATAAQLLVRAGDPVRLTLAAPLRSPKMVLPDATERTIALEPTARELVFGETQRQGVYRLITGTNATQICVNLLDPAETDNTPRAELELGKYARIRATTTKQANLEMWRWIAGAGLLVLLFEWWYYHRRTA
jgi:uncharacterized protein (DUF58 family)